MNQRLLLTGGTGFVGQRLSRLLANDFEVLAPSRQELDITNNELVIQYLDQYQPSSIVHAAAITPNHQPGGDDHSQQGLSWTTNVEATKTLFQAALRRQCFFVYLSTGSVFAGTKIIPGPFKESDPVANDEQLSWYAITKKTAEKLIQGNGAIIRLSHPIGGRQSPTDHNDYLERLLHLYHQKQLYPLFTDVSFPLSFLPDVASSIAAIVTQKRPGIYHPVTTDTVTPFQLLTTALEFLNLPNDTILSITFQEFSQQHPQAKLSQFYALDGATTRQQLSLPDRTWKQIVELCQTTSST